MNGLDFQDDDYETIQKRLLEKAQLNLLRNAPQDTFDQIAPILGGGIDLASKLGSYGAKPIEILTGKQIAPGQVTNAEAEVRKIIADRQTRQRQEALDDTNLLKALEDIKTRRLNAQAMADYRNLTAKNLADYHAGQLSQAAKNAQLLDEYRKEQLKNYAEKLVAEMEQKKAEAAAKAEQAKLDREAKAEQARLNRELQRELKRMGIKEEKQKGIEKSMVPGMSYVGEYAPTEDDAKQMKKKLAAWMDLNNSMEKLVNVVDEQGLEWKPSEKKRLLDSNYRDVQIKAKEAANLGAITGPDMEIITGQIPNPTSIMSSTFLTAPEVTNVIKDAKDRFKSSFDKQSQAYGFKLNAPYKKSVISKNEKNPPISKDDAIKELRRRGLVK